MSPAKVMIGYLQSRVAELEAELAERTADRDAWMHLKADADREITRLYHEFRTKSRDLTPQVYDARLKKERDMWRAATEEQNGKLAEAIARAEKAEAEVSRLSSDALDRAEVIVGLKAEVERLRHLVAGHKGTCNACKDYFEGGGRESGSEGEGNPAPQVAAAAKPAAHIHRWMKSTLEPVCMDCAARKERDG